MKRIGGFRRKTRKLFKKTKKRKGKVSLTDYFQSFKTGDKVHLSVEPAVQKGMYNPRFANKAGVVEGTQGNCYKIHIKDSGKSKTLIVHPVHLKKL